VDRKTLDTRVHSLNYQLAIIGHGGWGGDPDYLAARFGGRGRAPGAAPSQTGLPGLDDPVLMDLLKRQQITFDPHRRRRVVADIQRKLAELVPEIPLYYKTGYSVYRPADYDGWMNMYDHHNLTHSKLSYLQRSGPALLREDNGDD
jgi:peptide/nickel transport system substrate-binding protein